MDPFGLNPRKPHLTRVRGVWVCQWVGNTGWRWNGTGATPRDAWRDMWRVPMQPPFVPRGQVVLDCLASAPPPPARKAAP